MTWKKIIESGRKSLAVGVLLRFSAAHTNNNPLIVIAVSIPQDKALSFFELSGGNKPGMPMGYGNPTLPEESVFENTAMTVDVSWLLSNFDYICIDVDTDQIEFLEYYEVGVASFEV